MFHWQIFNNHEAILCSSKEQSKIITVEDISYSFALAAKREYE